MAASERQTILILGGARSGKSDYAQRLAGKLSSKVLYVATATAGDAEMAERINKHRLSRPPGWQTLEATMDITPALKAGNYDIDVVLLDCLTLLTTNVLLSDEEHPDRAEQRLLQDLDSLCNYCQDRGITLIVISNEVGMGVVPPYPLGRQYRDMLGRVNQMMARRADRLLWLLAGFPIDVKMLSAQLPDPFRSAME